MDISALNYLGRMFTGLPAAPSRGILATDDDAPAAPPQGILGRVGDAILGIPATGNITPEERAAMRQRAIIDAGLHLAASSYGVPGQPAPSIGRNLPGALLAGRQGAMDYLTQQDALDARAVDPEAQRILQSINWRDMSPNGLQGAALALLRVGKTKEAQVITDLLKNHVPNSPTFTGSLSEGGPSMRLQMDPVTKRVSPVLGADGKPIYERDPNGPQPRLVRLKNGHYGLMDVATGQTTDTSQEFSTTPPQYQQVARFAADQVGTYMAQMGDNPEAPSAADAFIQHWSSKGGLGGLRTFVSSNAKLMADASEAFGRADMAMYQMRRGSIEQVRAAGQKYVPVVGDDEIELRRKAVRRAQLMRDLRGGGAASYGATMVPQGGILAGTEGPPEAP
jgi:hypothetical protein